MIFLPIMLFSFLVSAQTTTTLKDGIVLLSTTKNIPEVACEENIPERCHHLSREACDMKKGRPEIGMDMDFDLEEEHVLSLPDRATALQIARGKQAGIRAAETLSQTNAGITSSDLNTLVSEVKRDMVREINASPITNVVKGRMTSKINSITFANGADYIAGMKRWFIDNQGISAAAAEAEATKFYTDTCGVVGMEANAFYDPNTVAFVICPGLVQSLSEYGGSKATFLNALSFTVAHEIGHAIDTSLYPQTYRTMGSCHESEGNFDWEHQSTEIVADFWGGKIIAERMKSQQVTDEDALRTLNIAQGYLCNGLGDEHHPEGNQRIDRIMGRDPQVRAQLACPPPTQDTPFCGINGRQSER